MKTEIYQVAGLPFAVTMSHSNQLWHHLQAYTPFALKGANEAPLLFELEIDSPGICIPNASRVVGKFDGDLVDVSVSCTSDRTYVRFTSEEVTSSALLAFDSNFNAQIALSESLANNLFNLGNALMLLFTLTASRYQTLLFHASAVECSGGGYLFLGRSGTGKSTHSRLWLESIEGTELLNDDNPAVRITGGIPYVYGTPWSGKTPCYKNRGVALNAITRIVQAPHNKIERLGTVRSYASLLPACSCARWDKGHSHEVHKAVEELLTKVACYQLECLPNAEAAAICHQTVSQQ